ncbi:MAG: hypothetical protein P8L85_14300, partial [Rubripirellula sp.]|nr:hypothetical protein [Rubripirellula sp.]
MRSPFGSICARALLLILAVGSLGERAFTQESPAQESPVQESSGATEALGILAERGVELTDADLASICRVHGLRSLDLTGCSLITDKGLACVAELQQLESLSLGRCHRISLEGIRTISELPVLTRLDLSETRLSFPEVYRELTKLPSLTRLEVRDIRGLNSAGLERLTNLTYLDISNSTGGIKDADLAPLAALTALTHLNLNGSRNWGANKNLTDAGLKHLESLTALEFLGLFGHFKLTAEGYNPLFSKLNSLKTLEMGCNWPLKGGEIQLPA